MSRDLAAADFEQWRGRLRKGERRALARLLTYAESSRPEDGQLMNQFLQYVGAPTASALRVGVTGIPGAGKSTLIDALGRLWIGQGLRVAVLAVDPSSVISGGSVLGDKVRMARLGASDNAFIRPLPSSGALGGVTVHLDECARLCELAGYDRIVIETVGVGQSEVDVALICDVLTVVVVPGTGDELQAMKRGISEVTDVLVINKSDSQPETQLRALVAMYGEGLSLVRGHPMPVIACSALAEQGIDEWSTAVLQQGRRPTSTRADRRSALFRRLLEHAMLRRFWTTLEGTREFRDVLEQVRDERLTLRSAAEQLLDPRVA